MVEVLTAGEILVEIMRKEKDVALNVPGDFYGPFPSGAPAIFIDQVALLGHAAGIVGSVGKDEFGKQLLVRLDMDGVDISHIRVSEEYSTAVAFVSYKKDGSRRFIYHIGNAAAGQLEMPDQEFLRHVKVFHIMGCSLMSSARVREIIINIAKMVSANGGIISFDPNIRVELLKGNDIAGIIGDIISITDIFMPGEGEFASISSLKSMDEAVEWAFSKGIRVIVIKMGKRGARYIDSERDVTVKAIEVDEIDPTGAGDSFDAGFICGYLEGMSPEDSLRLASVCGGLNAAFFGPMEGVFPRQFIEYYMKKDRDKNNG